MAADCQQRFRAGVTGRLVGVVSATARLSGWIKVQYIAQHACIILIGRCMTACDKSTRCFGSDGSFDKTCCGGNSVYALWIALLCGHLSRSTHGISKTKKQHKKMRHFYVIKITFQLTTRAARQIYVDDRRRWKFFSLGKWRKCLAIETPRSLCNTAAH